MDEGQMADKILETFPAIDRISEPDIRHAIVACWVRIWQESNWEDLEACPFNPAFPNVSLVSHVNCVVDLALAAADVLEQNYPELKLDRDLLLTGALLHDLSKVVEIEPKGDDEPGYSELNQMLIPVSQGRDAFQKWRVHGNRKFFGTYRNAAIGHKMGF